MDFIVQGLGQVLSPMNLLLIAGGVFLGIVVGAIPGLTATLAISLLVPFTFSMEPIPALVLLLAIYCGGIYGGSITAILIRTPGTPGAAATVLDGYPMGQQGRAGEAIGIATIGSGFGGFVSALIMIFLSPQISKMALSFSGPEYFALAVFGLSVIFSLSKDVLKGLATGVLGLIFATVGMDLISPYPRFTMGIPQLLTGLPLLPVVIGLFAIAEVFRMAESKLKDDGDMHKVGRIIPTKDIFKRIWGTMVRSSLIGTFIGALPGAGANVAAFVSYNTAKKISKNPERFGKGAEEGVAAPETANNAVTGGALIPMLTLGIPGDAVTAVLLSALTIQGFQPGPLLFRDHMNIVYPIFACMLLANVIMTIMGLSMAKFVAKIATVSKAYLLPAVAIFAIVGSFAASGNVFEIWVALAFGFLGYLLEKLGFDVSPIVLSVILGPMMEKSLRQSLIMSKGDPTIFLTRPISCVLLIIAVVPLAWGLYKQFRGGKTKLNEMKEN